MVQILVFLYGAWGLVGLVRMKVESEKESDANNVVDIGE